MMTVAQELAAKARLRVNSPEMIRRRGGTRSARVLRSHAVGDLLCKVEMETPVNLNERQKELLREFEESLCGDTKAKKKHSPKAEGFFDGVKKFFQDLNN